MKNVKSARKLVLALFIIYTFFVSWVLDGLFELGGKTLDLNTPISLLILPSPLLLIISSILFNHWSCYFRDICFILLYLDQTKQEFKIRKQRLNQYYH